jgi:hypothetical protein
LPEHLNNIFDGNGSQGMNMSETSALRHTKNASSKTLNKGAKTIKNTPKN